MAAPPVFRYAAFSDDPAGGNPAGVVLEAGEMSDEEMQAVAAEVGYSETAFVAPASTGEYDVRYFSPLAEVMFCGHATIAAGVALAERGQSGDVVFNTREGPVALTSSAEPPTATLTSVEPRVLPLDSADLDELLQALGWDATDLDPALPPRVGYAGVFHPIVAAATHERLRDLDYDFDRLTTLMHARDWTTIQLVWREHEHYFHARDPFPIAGVLEDPATGAAAAALGAYLRELALITPPATVEVLQGEDFGRPSHLTVDIPESGGISVTGKAVRI